MARHLFSSGEILYKQNVKQLEEGIFSTEFLEYDGIANDTIFKTTGKLDNREDVNIEFTLDDNSMQAVQMKKNINILMQSDIFEAEWKAYKIIE